MPVIELLLDTGWLPVEASENRDAIGRAVTSMLSAMAETHAADPENSMSTRGQTAARLRDLLDAVRKASGKRSKHYSGRIRQEGALLELISFVFSNLRLNGKKPGFSLRSPFDLMVNRPDHASWLGD